MTSILLSWLGAPALVALKSIILSVKSIIFSVKFIIFSVKFIIVSVKFIILSVQFIIFSVKSHLAAGRCGSSEGSSSCLCHRSHSITPPAACFSSCGESQNRGREPEPVCTAVKDCEISRTCRRLIDQQSTYMCR